MYGWLSIGILILKKIGKVTENILPIKKGQCGIHGAMWYTPLKLNI